MKLSAKGQTQALGVLLTALCRLKQDLVDSDRREFDGRITRAIEIIESIHKDLRAV